MHSSHFDNGRSKIGLPNGFALYSKSVTSFNDALPPQDIALPQMLNNNLQTSISFLISTLSNSSPMAINESRKLLSNLSSLIALLANSPQICNQNESNDK